MKIHIELTFTGDGRYKCDGLAGTINLLEPLSVRSCEACPRFTWCPLSHVAAITAEVKDLKALEAACKELGLQFMHGQKTHKWYGHWVGDYHGNDAAFKHGIDTKNYGKCEHAIKVPGCEYEIGVVKTPNGNHTLVYDFWGPGRKIVNTLGKGCEKLVQYYGLHAAQAVAKSKGLITQRKVLNTGKQVEGLGLNPNIKLVVTGNL